MMVEVFTCTTLSPSILVAALQSAVAHWYNLDAQTCNSDIIDAEYT